MEPSAASKEPLWEQKGRRHILTTEDSEDTDIMTEANNRIIGFTRRTFEGKLFSSTRV